MHPLLDFAEVYFTKPQWQDLATHVGTIRDAGNRTQNQSTLTPMERDEKYLGKFFNEMSMPCPKGTREGSFWPLRSFDAEHYNLQAFRHTTWGMACRGNVNGEAIGRPLIEVCAPIAEDSKGGVTSA